MICRILKEINHFTAIDYAREKKHLEIVDLLSKVPFKAKS